MEAGTFILRLVGNSGQDLWKHRLQFMGCTGNFLLLSPRLKSKPLRIPVHSQLEILENDLLEREEARRQGGLMQYHRQRCDMRRRNYEKIAVIHTTPGNHTHVGKAARCGCGTGEAVEVVNLLDDSMLPEINREGQITEGVKYRLNSLLLLAQTTGRTPFCAPAPPSAGWRRRKGARKYSRIPH